MMNGSNLPARTGSAAAALTGVSDYEAFWNAAVQRFMGYLREQKLAEETRRTYLKALRRFFGWAYECGIPLDSLDSAVLAEYSDSLASLSCSSANVNIVSLRRFFAWMAREGYWENIAKDIECFRMSKGFVKEALTIEQQKSLLDYLRSRPAEKGYNREALVLRDYAIVNLFLRTGLRSVEVIRASRGDLTEKYGKTVLMVWGKGHERPDTPLALTEPAYRPIMDYLAARGEAAPEDPLFACEGKKHHGGRMCARTVQGMCKGALRAIGLDSHAYSTHSLRHSTGETMLALGASVKDVQRLLRHKDEKTTMIYVWKEEERQRIVNPPQQILDDAIK